MEKEKLSVEFIGKNADSVTGSMTVVRAKGLLILLEAGLYQTNDMLEDYKVNNRNLGIKVKNVDFIILGHIHADHSMLIPRLVAEGFKGKIIVPLGTRGFFELMGLDSAYIIERDCMSLTKKYNKAFHRMYTTDDVYASLNLMEEYPFGEIIHLTNRVSIRYTNSGHIINAAQIELWVKNEVKNKTVKILYTSDLGNVKIPKPFVRELDYATQADLVIGECTYSKKGVVANSTLRKRDISKIENVIDNNSSIVEIPVFSLDRTPTILALLYDLYHNKEGFKQDIVVDSPLAINLLHEYLKVLKDNDKTKLEEILNWDRLVLLKESKDSKAYMENATNCVVLAASGMLTKGRSRHWLKKVITDSNNTIMFVGYASDNSISSILKKKNKNIVQIDGEDYENKCKIVDLKSFTSHMQYDDLISYYSSINANKIALVHSNQTSKVTFAKELELEVNRKFGKAKIISANKSTVLHF